MTQHYPYPQKGLEFTFSEPSGGARRFVADGESIATSEMRILGRGFVYPNSQGRCALPMSTGESRDVKGRVVECSHVTGATHRITIAFEQEVRLDGLVAAEALAAPTAGAAAGGSSAKEMRVLYLDDHAPDLRLMEHRLKGTGISLKACSHLGAAIDTLREENFDVVLCDYRLEGGHSGLDLLKECRSGLHRRAFVFVTGETTPSKLDELVEAGATTAITKPIDYQRLPDILRAVQESNDPMDIVSVLGPGITAEAGAMTTEFIETFSSRLVALERARKRGEVEQALVECRDLASCAAGFGFAGLARIADRAYGAIEARSEIEGEPVAALLVELRRLSEVGPMFVA
ncbi:MAG: response regulator [Planctomycetota bacterium]